jgi:hypothetical protein
MVATWRDSFRSEQCPRRWRYMLNTGDLPPGSIESCKGNLAEEMGSNQIVRLSFESDRYETQDIRDGTPQRDRSSLSLYLFESKERWLDSRVL